MKERMKKYPFSSKAIKAVLVASLALSPVAGFGASKAQAAGNAEYSVASYDSVQALIDRLNTDYDRLSQDQKDYLRDAQEKVYGIIAANWVGYTDKIFVKNVNDVNADEVTLLKAVVGLTNATNTTELATAITDFRTPTNKQMVANVVGSEITVDELLAYIADVEVEYKGILEARKDAIITDVVTNDPQGAASIISGILALPENKDKEYTDITIQDIINYINSNNVTLSQTTVSVIAAQLGSALEDAMVAVGDNHPDVNTALENKLVTKSEIKTVFAGIVTAYFTKPSSGGGGGGAVTPPKPEPKPIEIELPQGAAEVVKEQNQSGKVEVVTKVSTEKVNQIVNLISAEKAVVPLTLEKPAAGEVAKAQVPAALFTEAVKKNAAAVVEVKTEEASYKLPANEINVANLAEKLGVSPSDVQINISVNVVNAADVKGNVDKNNLNPVSKVIEFTVTAVSGNKEQHITTFSTYVEREIVGDTDFNSNKSTAVRLNDNGTFSPIPTLFNGKTATIKSLTNSKYTIVQNDKTFTDVNNGANFFEANIEKLASKYIINGKTADTYAPSQNITRGEFAALISRSLGLVAKDPSEKKFSDVSTTQAVNKNGEINAAVEAGIIKGYTNGEFAPNKEMTRAEAAIMIARAMDFTKVPASKLDTTKKLTSFTDNAAIGQTSLTSVEKVVQAGIMSGFGNGEFGAYKNTQRDQMAKVLDKFLQTSNLIN